MSKPIHQVSIGMPVYNGERFIREALDSLLAQTFTDFELIISDNASTDGTEAICREYAARDPRIRYVRQSENRGAAANFQFVLNEAVGEYFMWAAHDDQFYKKHLEKLLKLHQQSFYIMTASQPEFIELNSNKKFDFKKIPKSTFKGSRCEILMKFIELHHWDYAKATIIYGLYRRKMMPQFSISDDLADIGSDLLYLMETMVKGKIGFIPDVTWLRGERFYRPESFTRNIRFKYIKWLIYRYVPARLACKRHLAINTYFNRIGWLIRLSQCNSKKLAKVINNSEKEVVSLLFSRRWFLG